MVVDSDAQLTTSMRRMMKMMDREEDQPPDAKPDLEINPDNAMLAQLDKTRRSDATLAGLVTEQLFDSALMAAGLLEEPRAMLARVNSLIEKVLAKG